ncbi:glycoside hydrolase family 13 protein [Paenibacillus oenotherae]|uniref:Glycoside hydrolase family 13 protein n=1 Tax=Paenibacillus oenotherae TaxID=1435645 RepID=A0ABS7D9H1_9BACL|nr:glycoside hydrolase family 13 protein [Paenibacillus oenotherae]MBW7476585.1 glycoside hydrolase family 13 protein [Paenibacillus oenotherae]
MAMTNYYGHDPITETTLVSLQQLEIRLRLPRNAQDVQLVHWNKYKLEQYGIRQQAMTKWAEGDGTAFYRTILKGEEARIRYLQYTFQYEIDGETVWLSGDGVQAANMMKGSYSFSYAGDRDIVSKPEWINSRVWYQIFPERFCNGDASINPEGTEPWGSEPTRDNFMGGDLRGMIDKLDYLSSLGINALYLNPIFTSRSNHKYDTVDYFEIDPQFGTAQDLRELVSECHKRDIKVVLDLVFNHCGYYHPYFQDVVQRGESSVYKDWFYINEYPVVRSEERYDSVGYYQWMPKLRTSNPEVKQFVFDIVSFWQKETGIDGWRIDVADEVEISFLRELKSYVKTVNPNAFIIAEIWYDAKALMMSGGVDSVMNYELRTILFDYVLDRSITLQQFHGRLIRLAHRYSLAELHQMFNLLGSHDTERILTRCGEREEDLLLLLAIQFVFPGNPVVYYGDELGMTGENDPGCRGSMPWDTVAPELPLLRQMQQWIARKTSDSILQQGELELVYAEGYELYAIKRRLEDHTVTLLLNFSLERAELDTVLPVFGIGPDELADGYATIADRPAEIGPRQVLLFHNIR